MPFRKNRKSEPKAEAKVAPKVEAKVAPKVEPKAEPVAKPMVDSNDRIIGLLTEILNALPTKEEQLFIASITGLIAKKISIGADGKPYPGLMDLARKFSETLEMR